MLPLIATQEDAAAFGLSVNDVALRRASTRVRSFTGQQVTAGSSTATLRGSRFRLPQRPVSAITSVQDEDGNDVEYTLNGGGLLDVCSHGPITVEWSHGWAEGEVPDEVLELVCTVASRIAATPDALATGVTQEQSGSASQTFGSDAYQGVTGLTSSEKATLRRLFPRYPKTIVMAS